MKRWILWLGLFGALCVLPGRAKANDTVTGNTNKFIVACDTQTAINTAAQAHVQLVALQTGRRIWVCGFNIEAGGTTNVNLEYGTGTNCGTGNTALTGPYNMTAQNVVTFGGGLGACLIVPAGNALCVNNSQAIQISGVVSWTQF